ncbi:Trihelix transcription factor GT-2 [Platanthera zijinensis]|uniref:Trihelix transcription factor GT-2 n=1 Tax=Platanthera zijinensis TaxID=2320716 RepID=A0AAP0BYW9_9ASPA
MQQQQGGSQYGVPPPELLNPPFFTVGAGSRQQQQRHVGIHAGVDHLQQPAAESASPISSRSAPPASIFDDFGGGGGVVMRGISDEEALCAGEEGDRGASCGGNRWPRQETLVLLKVRSEMDSAFRDATLKGPLWEDVSRKLAELGYMRSAKKCKEKFENVHKYYKRTKEGRAGRQDGKSYRFFSQLEALHTPAAVGAAAISSFALPPPNTILVTPQITEASGPGSTSLPPPPAPRSEPPPPTQLAALQPSAQDLAATFTGAAGVSFSSNTSSSSSSDSDTDDGCAGMLQEGRRKRKRESWPGSGGKTMAFFEGLMKELMERQEVMQQRFLDTIEKREQDRMIREEAWKRQEMARLNREYELMAQERAMAANRDAAVISFLQKFTAGGHGNPPPPANAPESSPEEAPPQAAQQPENQIIIHQSDEIAPHQPSQSVEPESSAAAAAAGMPLVIAGGCGLVVVSPPPLSTSRWPKAEVLALIKLRSGLDTRYMDSGPKGPLWEEISQAMKRLGYSRSTKRCKEKWENINKYFKKVKEGNKKRPEDAKTCPYYHELDALYRKKLQQEIAAANIPDPPVSGPPQQEIGSKNPAAARINFGNGGNFEGRGGVQLPRSNGAGISQVFFGGSLGSGSGAALKRPEDIIKELMEQQQHGEEDEYDEEEEDDEEEEEDDGNQRYEIQFQRQNAPGGPRGGATEKAPPPSASNPGSFLAMVQ